MELYLKKYLQERILNEIPTPGYGGGGPGSGWDTSDIYDDAPIEKKKPLPKWRQISPHGVPVPGTPSRHRGGHATSDTVTDENGVVWDVIYHWVDGVLVDTTWTIHEPDDPWTYQNDPNWLMNDDPYDTPGGAGGG